MKTEYWRSHAIHSAHRTITLVKILHDLKTLFQSKSVHFQMGLGGCQKGQLRKIIASLKTTRRKQHPFEKQFLCGSGENLNPLRAAC